MVKALTLACFLFCLSIPDATFGCCEWWYEWELKELQNNLGTAINDAKLVNEIIAKVQSDAEGDRLALMTFVQYIDKLSLDTKPHEEAVETAMQAWNDIDKMSVEKLKNFHEQHNIIVGNIQDFMKNHAKYINRLQGHINNVSSHIHTQSTKMFESVDKFAAKHGSAFARSMALEATMRRINEQMDKSSKHQNAAVENLRTMTNGILANLTDEANKLQSKVLDTTLPAAKKALSLSASLRGILQSSLESISERLNNTIDDQWRLELIIRYGQAVNRIHYLHDMLVDIDSSNETSKQDDLLAWANTTLNGLPSGQPIEDVIVDIVKFIGGGSAAPIEGEFDIANSRGTSLLDVYRGKIKEIADETSVIRYDQVKDFIVTYCSENPPSSSITSESEGYMAEAMVQELRRIESAAFTMAIRARQILAVGPDNDDKCTYEKRQKRDTTKRSNDRKSKQPIKDSVVLIERPRYSNMSAIFEDVQLFYRIQAEAYNKTFRNISNVIRVPVPRVEGAQIEQRTPENDKDFVIQTPTNSIETHLRQLKLNGPTKTEMLVGCRFCTGKRCYPNNSLASVIPQCFFQDLSDRRGYDMHPNNSQQEELAAKDASESQPRPLAIAKYQPFTSVFKSVKIAQGINRVDDPATQYVCGVTLKAKKAQQENIFGISINVCLLNDSRPFATKNFWKGQSSKLVDDFEMVKVPVHLFNAMWVRVGEGTTVGVGLFVTSYPGHANINVLNLGLESRFLK